MKSKIAAVLSSLVLLIGLEGCGGGSSAQVQPPPPDGPTIISVTPNVAAAGSGDLAIKVTGSNLLGEAHNSSQVAWSANGSITLLPTTFVSSTQLTAVVPAVLLTNPVAAAVLLETGDPVGGAALSKSRSVSFTVKSLQLSITAISPSSAVVGRPDLTLTVAGTDLDFRHGGAHQTSTFAVWSTSGSQTVLSTTVLSASQLTAVVPATLLTKPVTVQISVQKVYFQDESPFMVSNSLGFSVTSAGPSLSSISPSAATIGLRGSQQFAGSFAASGAVAWSIEEGASGGSITSEGLYTAPSSTGVFHVAATSVTDPSKSASATVSVVPSGFTPTGNMSIARAGHTATLLANGRVLIAGGANGELDASAELFDPTTGTFTPTGSMTSPRAGATATLLADGKVLVTGGFGPGASMLPVLNTAELYDPQAGTFTDTGSMSVGRVRPRATLLNDGRVLIAGGVDSHSGGGGATASAELYDPSNGNFTPTGSMATDRADHTATLLASGKVLIVGGWSGHRADASDDPPWDPLFAELFDPASGSFAQTGSMSTTRIGHSAIRLIDGEVIVLGGIPSTQNVHDLLPDPQFAELYDPATGMFSSAGNSALTQTSYTATLLNSGMILIAGGEQEGIALALAELLDPTTGSLTTTGGLIDKRAGHTATLLKDGRVLVAGGSDSNGTPLASAELYK
jgi:hypothetical protein